jgi:hypothetical protein
MADLDPRMLSEVERGERWLSAFPTPAPSEDSIRRAKRAVRDELLRKSVAARRWSASYGALAAAATLALAVWAGWYATRNVTNAPLQVVQSDGSGIPRRLAQVDDEVIAPSDDSLAMANDIEETLISLENWSDDATWDLSGRSLSEAMDEIFSEPPREGPNGHGA